MESTGDLISIVNEINDKEVLVEEEVDLKLVDEHLAEKEKEINDRYEKFDQAGPEGWIDGEKSDQSVPEGWMEEEKLRDKIPPEEENDSNRLESKIDKLRMKWAGTGYEIVLEKLEMLESWKSTGDIEIKEGLLDWMIENEESTLMEEGEDILDGLEMMANAGEITNELLLDCTEMITTLIVARNLDSEEMMPSFQKAGNKEGNKRITRQSRAERMTKIRKELMSKKNERKPFNMRTWAEEGYQDLEIKRVKRR